MYNFIESINLFIIFRLLNIEQMESMNPGGTGKDRAAQRMLDKANLKPGAHVVEGTSGRSMLSRIFYLH
jgi:hypothetical protein